MYIYIHLKNKLPYNTLSMQEMEFEIEVEIQSVYNITHHKGHNNAMRSITAMCTECSSFL